ncbi:MAG: hypothetical protein JWN56_1018 [Sphingobacteriales bacterium]|nr:hypothetical protein [Sphingobacteriales bacterium]
MKRILFIAALIISGASVFAQSKINEGSITYNVEYDFPEQMKAFGSNFPKELKIYFKGDSASMQTRTPMFSSTSIINNKKEYERILMDLPMMNKKFSVILTPADQENMQDKMPQLTLKATSETKKIGNYNAIKYDVVESKSNKTFSAWLTKDVDLVVNPLTRFYDKNLGIPIEFTTYVMNGIVTKAILKEVKAESVPAGTFSASKDFEEITMDQLSQMMRGGR